MDWALAEREAAEIAFANVRRCAILYRSTARPAEAHAVPAPAFSGFAPTPEFPEIAEARGLLTEVVP